MSAAVLALVGVVAAALIGLLGVWFTTAATRSANRLRLEAEERQAKAEAEAKEQAEAAARRQAEAAEIRAERDRLVAYNERIHAWHIAEIERLTQLLAAAREAQR